MHKVSVDIALVVHTEEKGFELDSHGWWDISKVDVKQVKVLRPGAHLDLPSNIWIVSNAKEFQML